MFFKKARKRDLWLVNGFGLCLCLFMTMTFVIIDKKMQPVLNEVEITDALVDLYQSSAKPNKDALKALLVSHEKNKAIIKRNFNLCFHVFFFITLIFIANLILIFRVIKTEQPTGNNHHPLENH